MIFRELIVHKSEALCGNKNRSYKVMEINEKICWALLTTTLDDEHGVVISTRCCQLKIAVSPRH